MPSVHCQPGSPGSHFNRILILLQFGFSTLRDFRFSTFFYTFLTHFLVFLSLSEIGWWEELLSKVDKLLEEMKPMWERPPEGAGQSRNE